MTNLEKLAARLELATGRMARITGAGVILLDTDYTGPYAPPETYEALNKARAVVRRTRGRYTIEVHPACVCCYVRPAEKKGA